MTPNELLDKVMFECAFIAPESWDEVGEGKIARAIVLLEREVKERQEVIEKLRAQSRKQQKEGQK